MAGSFHNVFVLRSDMRIVHCINCGTVVGLFEKVKGTVSLNRVSVKKVVAVEYRITCAGSRLEEDHGHRYRLWTAIVDNRRVIEPKRKYYNSRGRHMNEECDEVRPGCLFEIVQDYYGEVFT